MELSPSIWRTAGPALCLVAAYTGAMSLLSYLAPSYSPSDAQGTLAFLLWDVPVFAIACWAGWLIQARRVGGLLSAGVAGALVFFVSHPIVHGTIFILHAAFGTLPELPMVLGGVAVSFLMFVPIFFVGGLMGAGLARVSAFLRERAA